MLIGLYNNIDKLKEDLDLNYPNVSIQIGRTTDDGNDGKNYALLVHSNYLNEIDNLRGELTLFKNDFTDSLCCGYFLKIETNIKFIHRYDNHGNPNLNYNPEYDDVF